MIYADDMIRIGTDKLLEFMDFGNREELAEFMVEMGALTLEHLAELLSQSISICSLCRGDYVDLEEEGTVCKDCIEVIRNKF